MRLAERYLRLKKQGSRYVALCPFHDEKTPSFSIDPDNGLYHCFGCKEGGNVFTFLQKMEGLSFREALHQLANEAGVDLGRYSEEPVEEQSNLGRLRRAHELAATFYQKCLEKAEQPRRYLEERRITEESMEKWRLGYAPDGWEHFLNVALKRDFKPDELVAAGLVRPRQDGNGHYDRFRNRLMFPITNVAGRVIAFGARALDPEDEPKYLNSPETPLFSKGRCFFGLDRAKAAVRSADTAVVLEGYTDVIMAHQAGVTEALAVLGTALTEDHARALGRLCSRVILVFDADEAGQKSAARSIEVLLEQDLEIRVARLPSGLDPCDYIVEHGGEEFRRLLDESLGFFEFRLQLARSNHSTETIEGRTAAFREVAEFASGVRDPAQRDMIVRWIADELRVPPRAIWAGLGSPRRTGGPAEEAEPQRSLSQSLPGDLLGLLLMHPELRSELTGAELDALPEGPERRTLESLLERDGEVEASDFIGSLTDVEMASAASRAVAQEQERMARVKNAAEVSRAVLKGYLDYLARRQEAERTSSAPRPEQMDDQELRRLAQRLKEKDNKSAHGR